jgi:hypothetical protein
MDDRVMARVTSLFLLVAALAGALALAYQQSEIDALRRDVQGLHQVIAVGVEIDQKRRDQAEARLEEVRNRVIRLEYRVPVKGKD